MKMVSYFYFLRMKVSRLSTPWQLKWLWAIRSFAGIRKAAIRRNDVTRCSWLTPDGFLKCSKCRVEKMSFSALYQIELNLSNRLQLYILQLVKAMACQSRELTSQYQELQQWSKQVYQMITTTSKIDLPTTLSMHVLKKGCCWKGFENTCPNVSKSTDKFWQPMLNWQFH